MKERKGRLSPTEWRVMLVLEQYPHGTTSEEVLRKVPDISAAHISVALRRIVHKGYATTEPLAAAGQMGRPPFLYVPAGPFSAELLLEIEEFLSTYIKTPEAVQLVLTALEAHRSSASLD